MSLSVSLIKVSGYYSLGDSRLKRTPLIETDALNTKSRSWKDSGYLFEGS